MRLTLFLILLLTACSQSPSPIVAADSLVPEDSAGAYCTREIKDDWVQDWPATVEIDSLTARKARKVIAEFYEENMYISLQQSDTLIDLNGDGYADILIEYYGLSGTGTKNRIVAYLFDPQKRTFTPQEQLSALVNPVFYFNTQTITSYYIATSGGFACKLKWNKKKNALDTVENISLNVVNYEPLRTEITYTISSSVKKTTTFESNAFVLPREYRRGRYKHLIRRTIE